MRGSTRPEKVHDRPLFKCLDRQHRVEQVPTPYRLRHRRVNSLGDRTGYRIQQRPLELADCVRFMAHVSANDRSGVLMRTLLSS
jgi:hypothetical protein